MQIKKNKNDEYWKNKLEEIDEINDFLKLISKNNELF